MNRDIDILTTMRLQGMPAVDIEYVRRAFLERNASPAATPAPVAQKVPDGFVLVPKEPTEDMLMDGCDAMTENHETANYGMCYGCGFKEVKAAWSAMLAAAQAQEEGK